MTCIPLWSLPSTKQREQAPIRRQQGPGRLTSHCSAAITLELGGSPLTEPNNRDQAQPGTQPEEDPSCHSLASLRSLEFLEFELELSQRGLLWSLNKDLFLTHKQRLNPKRKGKANRTERRPTQKIRGNILFNRSILSVSEVVEESTYTQFKVDAQEEEKNAERVREEHWAAEENLGALIVGG